MQREELALHPLWGEGTVGSIGKRYTEEMMFNWSFKMRFLYAVFLAEISPAKAMNFKSAQTEW